jgi:FkbM family methyltransferase
MTLQRKLINWLDQPGKRTLLASLATRYARLKTGLDVELFFDEAWIHRADDVYLAESLTFYWNADQLSQWKSKLGDVLDMHREWWFFQHQVKPGDIIVDIGAGAGEDALLFSKEVGLRGRVVAVEAHPITFRLLEKTCRLNRLTHNTTCVHGALMDGAGTVSIESRADGKSTVGARSGIDVPSFSLDELCVLQRIPHIDFLKINIEGAERFAIQGMGHMITKTRALCIACHDFRGDEGDFYRTKELVCDFITANGFKIVLREQHPDPWVRDHVCGVRA